MIKYLYYMLIAIFTISNIEIAEARKINLKSKKTSKSESADFGGKNFESELSSFKSLNNGDKTNKYYGWETNNNIRPSGSPEAVKGGQFTMLGGTEYPNTFRSLGKDSRQQINSLMDGLQYEPLLGFNYEYLEWEPVLATHWKISEDSLTYWFRIDPRARWADGKGIVAKDIVSTIDKLLTLSFART